MRDGKDGPGAFYVFADASRWTDDSYAYAYAFELFEKAVVGVAPGVDFGQMGRGQAVSASSQIDGTFQPSTFDMTERLAKGWTAKRFASPPGLDLEPEQELLRL